MVFHVLQPTRTIPKQSETTLYLVQDNWNDYSFQTLYHLYLSNSEGTTNLGSVKILKRGQTKADSLLISKDFDTLDEGFVSVGTSLDYYERLASLSESTRIEILTGLRDAVLHSELVPLFENEEGWRISVFRDQDSKSIEEHLALAGVMLRGNYTSLPNDEEGFAFQVEGWGDKISFELDKSVEIMSGFSKQVLIPSGLITIIGRNGSGKSTLLARIARIAHAAATFRKLRPLSSLGYFEPAGIGFPRIITVSYSAFDSFELPGVSDQEREQIIKDVRRGEGRFIFCGLRDIASEFEARLRDQENKSATYDEISERVSHTLLKPVNVLAEEFVRTLEIVLAKKREAMYSHAFSIISSDVSFDNGEGIADLGKFLNDDPRRHFLSWSTGHKIVMQIIVSLVAHITPRSLVLIDEPETHLHPPLLAALMHSVRYILSHQEAYGIVATHSPVVLQETMAQHVYIIRREGATTQLFRPSLETFGENVGMLTSEVFGMNSDVTDFHKILDQMVFSLKSVSAIEEKFLPHGMSNQARAYVMSKIIRQNGAA